jgi:cytochrome oxidase Cu insertion factor (SCO1/SenC/PrrC family)
MSARYPRCMRVALLLALLLAVAGCGGETVSGTTTAATETTAAGTSRVAGTTLDGKRISLADFRGKPVLVNVWSSW